MPQHQADLHHCCTIFTALSSAHLVGTPVFCSPCEPSLTLWVSDSSQYMCVGASACVCDSIAGAGKVATEVEARRQWRRWGWSSCASPWPPATRAACTWCWRACPPRPPTSWRTALPIPSNTDKLALVRPNLPCTWHALAAFPSFGAFQTLFCKFSHFLLSSVITSTPMQTDCCWIAVVMFVRMYGWYRLLLVWFFR